MDAHGAVRAAKATGASTLPWLEKYRPHSLSDVVGNSEAVSRLSVLASQGNLPNLILAGPPGTGKTTSVHCLARQLLGDRAKDAVLELNASDDRGIDVVRHTIKEFAQRRVRLPPGAHKLVILDEADAMTPAAQQALRRTMELHAATTRFALACNASSKIIEPIQSRCAVVRYARLSDEQVAARALRVAASERVEVRPDALEALVFVADGDMRAAINTLQAAAMVASRRDRNKEKENEERKGEPSGAGEGTAGAPSGAGEGTAGAPSGAGEGTAGAPSGAGEGTAGAPSGAGEGTAGAPSGAGEGTAGAPSGAGEGTAGAPSAPGDAFAKPAAGPGKTSSPPFSLRANAVVTAEAVWRVADAPRPAALRAVLARCAAGDLCGAHEAVRALLEEGHAPQDVVGTLFRVTRNDDSLPEFFRLEVLRAVGQTHQKVLEGVASPLQLDGMLAEVALLAGQAGMVK